MHSAWEARILMIYSLHYTTLTTKQMGKNIFKLFAYIPLAVWTDNKM